MNTAVMGPALVVLGVGAVVGLVLATRQRGSDPAIAEQAERNDLLKTREEVLLALKQLELDKDKLDPNDYASERASLVARGTAALRALDGAPAVVRAATSTLASLPDLPMPAGADDTLNRLRDLLDDHGAERFRAAMVALARERPKAVVPHLVSDGEPSPMAAHLPAAAPAAAAPVAAPAGAEPVMAPQYQGALAAIAVVAVLFGLYWMVQGDTVARRDGASMTGNQDLGSSQAAAPSGPMQAEIEQLEARVAANPGDVEALNELTEIFLSANDAGRAMDYNNKAYAANPNDPTTLTFKGVLRAMVSMFPEAIQMLEDVVAKHPDHAMAWTYLGLIQVDKGDKARGLEALRKAVELQPDNFALKQALQRAESGQPLTGGGEPPPPAPAATGDVVVSGTVALAAGVSVKGTETVYVSLKDPAGGPPLAAKRYSAGELPLTFTLTTADQVSMGGPPRPLPAQMSLSIRVDADNDGNAMTKTPLDPTVTTPVTMGQTGLALELAAP